MVHSLDDVDDPEAMDIEEPMQQVNLNDAAAPPEGDDGGLAEEMAKKQAELEKKEKKAKEERIKKSAIAKGTFVWKVKEWTKLYHGVKARIYSKDVGFLEEVNGFKWGYKNRTHISLYLDASQNDDEDDELWPVNCKFDFVVVNHLDPEKNKKMSCTHEFTPYSQDWGFSRLIEQDLVMNKANGYITEEDELWIQVHIWHLPSANSRGACGHVGIRNQGMTCYMNSLLQTLYHTPAFRRLVYDMETEQDGENTVPIAMQRMFYEMQTAAKAVGTTKLTKSFGWTSYESFVQHDVQELLRVLVDNLEKKMAGTNVEGSLNRLLQGKMRSYIKARDVDWESSHQETFQDVQVVVQGMKTLEESLAKYIEPEILDGDNQYNVEDRDLGKQDVDKGVIFTEMPSVLHFQLKRFMFDYARMDTYKVNDQFAFPDELDMSPYVEGGKPEDLQYVLHSVLVHSGGVRGGHYYAYARPNPEDSWYLFDDHSVTVATSKEAMDNNFGGSVEDRLGYKRTRISSAYMLVYIAKRDMRRVLAPVEATDIPRHLLERFQHEEEREREERKKKREERNTAKVVMITEEDMQKHVGVDLVNESDCKCFRVKRDTSLSDLQPKIEEEMDVPVVRQRFWDFYGRRNGTKRPGPLVKAAAYGKIFGSTVATSRFFMEISKVPKDAPAEQLFKPHGEDDAQLFYKWYDPKESTIRFLRTATVSVKDKIEVAKDMIAEIMGLKEEDGPLVLFEELSPKSVKPVDLSRTFREAKLQNGDILVGQLAPTPESEKLYEHPVAPEYYQYLRFRVQVHLRAIKEPHKDAFVVEMGKDWSYEQVTDAVGAKLDPPVEGKFVQLTTQYCGQPRRYAVEAANKDPLKDMLYTMYKQRDHVDMLFYDVKEIPVAELERKRTISITWQTHDNKEGRTFPFVVDENAKVGVLLEMLEKQEDVELVGTKKIELHSMYWNELRHRVEPGEYVKYLSRSSQFVAMETPEEHLDMKKTDSLVQVVHFEMRSGRRDLFGLPFYLKVSINSTVGDVRTMLKEKLKIDDEEWAKWKVGVCGYRATSYPDDETLLSKLSFDPRYDMIGLQHTNKNPKKQSTSSSYGYWGKEKPLVIHN